MARDPRSAGAVAPEGSSGVTVRSVYLESGSDIVLALRHEPERATQTRAAVLLCSPFGWDELRAHRCYVIMANTLAAAGYPTLRFDFPGAGESSGSPLEPDRFDSWRAAAATAAAHLRAASGCERIVAFGICLGGMIAAHALADGAPIDDLVLWAVPPRGSAVMREMRMFAAFLDPATRVGVRVTPSPDTLDIAGFMLTADAAAAIEGINLIELEVPPRPGRRALLLDRDGIPLDPRLRRHYERNGVVVTTASGTPLDAMLTDPISETPPETFTPILRWLADAPPTTRRRSAKPVEREALVTSAVRETAFELDSMGLRLRGTVVEPLGEPARLTALLLNAGAIRRIGPQRLWVELSRRAAERGVASLRLDIPGAGDSDGDGLAFRRAGAFYDPTIVAQIIVALDALAQRGLPPRFLVAGLCSGGHWAFQTAVQDERVRAAVMVNPGPFHWHDRYEQGAVESKLAAGVRRLGGAVFRGLRLTALTHTSRSLARLHTAGVKTFLLVGEGEWIEHDLNYARQRRSSEPWPGVKLVRMPYNDHLLVGMEVQRIFHQTLDRAIEEVLAAQTLTNGREPSAGATTSASAQAR